MWRQGYNKSDQVMARALMTPDELRRLDNDLCIILEKGVKPIKAPKYYYFKYSTSKLVEQYKADHNDIDPIDRGKWRKYNPYNPYVEEQDEKEKAADTKIESLDDLFEDVEENVGVAPQGDPQKPKVQENKVENKVEQKEDDSYDLQKELEAKFDELFGAFDDDD